MRSVIGEEQLLVDEEFASLRTCLSVIADPRQRWGRVHSLEGVLSLSVLCLMANGRSLLAGVRVKKAATERVCGFEIMPRLSLLPICN